MIPKCIVLAVLLSTGSAASAQSPGTTVFQSGTEGYTSFRIPAIIRAPNKDLLAFCEGRVNGASDFGNVKIVMRRSIDNGKSWGQLQAVASNDTLQAGNPAPVVDLTDPAYPGGRIFLFYCTGNQPESVIRKGRGVREVWYKTSTDNGRTWGEPVNITVQVHRPRQPSVNSAYQFPEDWRCYAITPGHAIQLKTGRYAGRIVVPINHSSGGPQPHFTDFRAGDFYSDDHGHSFHLSDDVQMPGGNEDMAAELGPGKVMLDVRNQRGDIRRRIIAISKDGAASWDTAYFDNRLIDPVCQGSILSIPRKTHVPLIAVCNNDDSLVRNNLTLRISYDSGRTWAFKSVVDRGGESSGKKDPTGYSDLIQLKKNRIGVLYERNNYKEIALAIVGF